MLAFCSHPRFYEHDTGPHHPERPDRLRAIFSAVRRAGLLASPNPLPDFPIDLLGVPPRQKVPPMLELEPQPVDESSVLSIHTQRHIDFVKHLCELHGVLDQGDTPVCAESFDIALLALGAMRSCCDAVMGGKARRAFAAVRPPGHHAERDRPMGFCLFNNIAFAARYAQKTFALQRVAIVDFDVHHGNGTQDIFDADPSVMFVSLHQNPRTCYPGSGYDWEIGTGDARGRTMNITFDPGSGDEEYLNAIDDRVMPALEAFKPELLLISAGFDAHAGDPLAAMELSDGVFEEMTRRLVGLATRHCGGRVISALEGGYDLACLGRCVVRHLLALS